MEVYQLKRLGLFKGRRKIGFFPLAEIGLVWLSMLLTLVACQSESPPVFRFWDQLKPHTSRIVSEENWRDLYQDYIKKEKNSSKHAQVEREGWATFYLKGKTFEAVLAPPDSVSEFEVKLGRKYVFDFGFGLFRDTWMTNLSNNLRIKFSVSIKTEPSSEPKELFSQLVELPREPTAHQIFFHRLNLAAYQGKRVTIILATEKVGQDKDKAIHELIPAFWINPLVYSPRKPGTVTEGRPNIILVSIDTLRADHLGCYGYSRPTSPTMDNLAAHGLIFTRAFSHAPYTLASHMSLLTGLYPGRHRVLYLNQCLASSIPTVASYLKEAGYICGAVTDGGQVSHRFGFAQGFDFFEEEVWGNIRWDSAEYIFERSAVWLRRHRDARFFLFIHTYQPHNPYHAPEPWGSLFLQKNQPLKKASLQEILGEGYPHLFQRLSEIIRQNLIALYDGEIRYTDEKLMAQLVHLLQELKLDRSTVLVITSDHGEEFFDHSSWGHGHQLYNEILHVPLIIKFPGDQAQGRQIDYPVRLVDVLPTLLEIAQVEPPLDKIDGRSLLALFHSPPEEEFSSVAYLPDEFAAFVPRSIALFKGEMKFIWRAPFSPEAREFFQPPPQEVRLALFNFCQDPAEKRNLATERVSLAREFFHQAEKLLEKMVQVEKAGRSREELNKALKERLRALGYVK